MPRARSVRSPGGSKGSGRGRGVTRGVASGVARDIVRGGGRRRGSSISRPHVVDDIDMGMLEDLPSGSGLEVPLHAPRTRTQRQERTDLRASVWYEESQQIADVQRRAEMESEPSTSALQHEPIDIGMLMDLPPGSVLEVILESSRTSTQDATNLSSSALLKREPGPSSSSSRPDLLDIGSEEEEEDDDGAFGEAMPNFISRAELMFYGEPDDAEEEIPLDAGHPAMLQDSFQTCLQDAAPSEQHLETEPNSDIDDVDLDIEMHGPTSMFDFQWKAIPHSPISPLSRREKFVGPAGPKLGPTASPYDAFTNIFDNQIMEHIAMETNRYAQHFAVHMMESGVMTPGSRIANWKDTNVDELYVYFALIMAMSILCKSKINDYWSTDLNSILWTPGFSKNMSYNRFQLLSRCLHFNNNANFTASSVTPAQAKVFKIQPLLDHLNNKFQSLYDLGQNIALDESLTQWKGWSDIKQYISNKASKTGIKTYEVCDSKTGYLWRFEVHAGREAKGSDDILPGRISKLVLRLLRGLEHTGRTVWMDSFYNSPSLARVLKTKGLDCVGTLRPSRLYVPEEMSRLNESQMRDGQVYGCTSGDVDLMVWKDHRKVTMISTYHGIAVANNNKPTVVADYNICMGGVDKKDQMLAMFPMERKRSHIWYKKFFRRLLNVSVLNAYILHKRHTPITHREFRIELVNSILEKHSQNQNRNSSERKEIDLSASFPVPKFSKQVVAHYPHRGTQRRSCAVCKNRTLYSCVPCKVNLCSNTQAPVQCHLAYHS